MSESDVDAARTQDDDENDKLAVLRSAYRALARLQTNLDNLNVCLKKGDDAAAHHRNSACPKAGEQAIKIAEKNAANAKPSRVGRLL